MAALERPCELELVRGCVGSLTSGIAAIMAEYDST